MAMKIREQPTLNLLKSMPSDNLRKKFKSFLIWENKPVSETVTTNRKRKSDAHSKADQRRVIDDSLDLRPDERTSQEMLEYDNKVKPLSNPSDPYDDFNVFWNPHELLDATKALASYDVKDLYKKNPYTVKNILHLVFLIMKYKPLLKDLLEVGEYFQRFPEDAKDENIVFIALFDILCRGNGITLENEMNASLRTDYKNIGLKVVYMQVVKDKFSFFEQINDRLNDIGGSSVHDLLPTKVPIQINIEFPMIFDVWINRSEFDVWPEKLLEGAGFKRASTRKSSGLTYNEIVDLPYFFELGVSNYSDFVKTSHYQNHVFIPTDRNHCLAMTQVIKQLYKGGITKGTVIQTHILSLGATAYLAYLLSIVFPSTMKLKVFGADQMKASFESYFELLNLKNIKVFSERFYIVNCRKKDIASTTCVLVNPETVFNPSLNLINETMKRGCDIVYLQSAYELFSENDIFDNSFINQYTHDLQELAKCNIQRALSIPKVKFVVYQSFDTTETADNNIALHVVNFARECSHTSVVSVKEKMSPTDMEDANYKYCKKLDLYFRQGNTPDSIVSPALWGSKPPFINTIYRVDPVICDTETEGDINYKYNISEKRSSGSHSVKSTPHTRDKYLSKGIKKIFEESSCKGSERKLSTVSSTRRSSLTVLQVKESPPDFKKMVLSDVMFENEPILIPSEKEDSICKKILKNKRNKKSKKISGDKKEVLFCDEIENMDSQQVSESDKSSQIQNKQSRSSSHLKENEINKSLSKKYSILMDNVSLRDEVGSIDSHEISESTKLSQNKAKQPRSSKSVKTNKINARNEQNKRLPNRESIRMEDIPSQVKNKSDKLKKGPSTSSKYFSQTSEKKNLKRNKYPRITKMADNVEEHSLLITQHSPVNFKEITNPKTKGRNLSKKSYETNQSQMLPRNKLKVEKEAPIISFGTKIRPKSNPIKQSEKKLPLKKINTTPEKKADVKEMSSVPSQQTSVYERHSMKKTTAKNEMQSVTSQQKSKKNDFSIKSNNEPIPLKFHINSRKKLSEMQERYKKEIMHNFQTHFFHTPKQSDIEEKSNSGHNRPSSSVSWKTYAKTAHKVSGLNLIKLLKKESFKKKGQKKRRKKNDLKRTESSTTLISTESELREIVDDEESKLSRRTDTVLWSEYDDADFNKLVKIDKNYLKPSIASSLLEIDKNDNNSISSSFLEIENKELKPSITLSQPVQSSNKNKEKTISKRKKTSKNKRKLKKKIKNTKTSKNEQKNESGVSDVELIKRTKSKSSVIKIVLEHSEGTQTKPLRKARVYTVGTQADHLDIYMSLNTEEERQESIRYYSAIVRTSANSMIHLDPEEVEEESMLKSDSSLRATIIDKGESKPDRHQKVTVSKMISWFRKLESKAPIPPRIISYILRRGGPIMKSIAYSKSEKSKSIVEVDTDDMIEEGVDVIPPLTQDYKIEDAQTILAQMKMYEAGERNLNKLISTDFTEFIDYSLMEFKGMGQEEPKKDKPVLEEREEIVALNKNLLKFKADEVSIETFTDDDGLEEEESFNMETKGKEMNNLLSRLVDNIFEADAKPNMRTIVDTDSINNVEPDMENSSNAQKLMVDSEEQLQSHSMEEVWNNTTREAWNKRNHEMPEEPVEENKIEEAEDNLRYSDLESEPVGTSIFEVIPKKTPTDGLSPLARELYEIRDVIEFYLHSKVEPLDWREMIDRHAED